VVDSVIDIWTGKLQHHVDIVHNVMITYDEEDILNNNVNIAYN